MKHVLLCAAGAAALLAAPAPVRAQTLDITGKWDVTFNSVQGTIPGQFEFKKDGEMLTGTLSSGAGEGEVGVTLANRDVTITFPYDTPDGPIPITLTGTVDGDSIKGTIDADGENAGDWVATRVKTDAVAKPATTNTASASAPAAAADLTGTWQFHVTTAAQNGSPVFVLKQDGDKLTGTYDGQYGQVPLAGTIKDGVFDFAFDLDIQGTPVHVVYEGTMRKDGLSGSVAYGDMADGTFTAEKKK
jgi:hypothetical protein